MARPHPFLSRAWRIVAFAALVGPAVGTAAATALFLATGAPRLGLLMADWTALLTLGPLRILLWGYSLGLPPAIGGSLLFAIADSGAPPTLSRAALAVACGAAGSAVLFALTVTGRPGSAGWGGALHFVLFGAVAAWVCWLLAGALRSRAGNLARVENAR